MCQRGKRFGRDDEVIEEVKKWLRLQESNCYKNVLVARWSKAVEVDGVCIGK